MVAGVNGFGLTVKLDKQGNHRLRNYKNSHPRGHLAN
jgi:hypothetical protein